jgi:hypothetical protein
MKVQKEHSFSFEKKKSVLINIKELKVVNKVTGINQKKKLKNKNSATKKIEPGKPRNIKRFNKLIKNNFGHKKLTPLISVIKRVLKRLFIASTKRNELVDKRA